MVWVWCLCQRCRGRGAWEQSARPFFSVSSCVCVRSLPSYHTCPAVSLATFFAHFTFLRGAFVGWVWLVCIL